MALADAAGPAGLLCLCLGAAIFGESREVIVWTIVGAVVAVLGVILLILSR